MFPKLKILFLLLVFGLTISSKCDSDKREAGSNENKTEATTELDAPVDQAMKVGASRLDLYLPKIQNLNVALLVNQTSTVGDQHLVDILLSKGVSIKKIFSPEHGFRGEADAGEKVTDAKDPKTGIPLVSLYGAKRKPGADDLAGIDMVIFDIQDVGARFYTYISTMHLAMEACAENKLRFLILDRPNPNGHYVDGPILDPEYQSFVGMHPVPIVHGMTVGEYARMINGEGWLKDGIKCQLEVIDCANYDHNSFYELPVKPSPNLPNIKAIYLYPSLCLFEPTSFSIGRGTNTQFQVIGHPEFKMGPYSFTPEPMPGAKNPKHKGKECRGENLSELSLEKLRAMKLNLGFLVEMYLNFPDKSKFFVSNSFFDKLAGGTTLKKQLAEKWTQEQIRESWKEGLIDFKKIRKKYLIYKDFE